MLAGKYGRRQRRIASSRWHRLALENWAHVPVTLARYDLHATDHDAFDYAMIARHAKLIVDTRCRYLEPAAHVVKA